MPGERKTSGGPSYIRHVQARILGYARLQTYEHSDDAGARDQVSLRIHAVADRVGIIRREHVRPRFE